MKSNEPFSAHSPKTLDSHNSERIESTLAEDVEDQEEAASSVSGEDEGGTQGPPRLQENLLGNFMITLVAAITGEAPAAECVGALATSTALHGSAAGKVLPMSTAIFATQPASATRKWSESTRSFSIVSDVSNPT